MNMAQKLWTRNFTIITIGTIISMMGNAVSNFTLGLVVFDNTNSTLLYSLFIILNTIPRVIVPMIVGPIVDRYSRKNIIVNIDTIYGFLFLLFSYITYIGFFNYSFYIFLSIVLGTLDSFYSVAYESLYPEFITEGNFSKAYSISSLIYPIANTIMVPIAGFAYEKIGVTPLFIFNSAVFFITQAIERLIDVDESHLKSREKIINRRYAYWRDLQEGISYIKGEPGLLAITAYFFISNLTSASIGTLFLPYFTGLNMVSQYSVLMSIATFGRIIGGLLHYRFRYPTEQKFKITLFVYVAIAFLEGVVLFSSYPIMMVINFLIGILGVTSFNIRISGTQNYISSDKRGRFNGMFMMITMFGSVIGQFLSGFLGDHYPIPYVIAGSMIINAIGALVIMLKYRPHVKKIYNQNI